MSELSNRFTLPALVKEKEIKDQLVTDFVSDVFTTDQNTPFLFKNREYWYPIYNNRWRMLVIMSSRQAEKSSFIAKRSLYELLYNPGEQIMYATALFEHLKAYAHAKIDNQFEYGSNLRAEYIGKGAVYNLREKHFANGSILLLCAIGYSPESGRGKVSRKIYFDETQSIDSDNIPILMEITETFKDTSEYAFLGTPLTPLNTLSKRFESSWQYEWIIRCSECHKDNPPLGKGHIDSKKPYLFCVLCGKGMKASQGRWVKQNPSGKYPGFRICRLMTPNCVWRSEALDGVLDKYDGPDAYPEYMFANEVLGLPEGVGIQPITMEALYANCATGEEDYEWIDPQRPPSWLLSGIDVVATIDWAWNTAEVGQSYTIYALWIRYYQRIKCIYAKRQVGPQYVDPDFGLNEMINVFVKCNVQHVGTDYGIGHKENIRMRNSLGQHPIGVHEFLYAGTATIPKWNNKERRYHVGKTESLDVTFSAFLRRQFMFPRVEIAKQYLSDVMNVFSEYNPNTKRRKYEHSGEGPDDFLHLANYARMIFQRL